MQGLMIVLLAGVAFLVAVGAPACCRRPQVPRPAPGLPRHRHRILAQRLPPLLNGIDEYLARSAALRGERPNGTQYRPDEPSDDGPPAEPDGSDPHGT